MTVEFLPSKSGEQTAKYNGIFLHSSYAPVKEAQRFYDAQQFPFKPEAVVILEPALSYCTEKIKAKANCNVFAIRYCNDFIQNDSFFEKSFYNLQNLDEELLAYFGEEKIFSVFFVSWGPSEKAFPSSYSIVSEKIKAALEKAKTLLVTRQFFEKKWLINSVSFIKHAKKFLTLKKVNLPVLIIASGPSLKGSIEIIKNNQSKFFIIGLSSAISVLQKNKIYPDMCLSTDGGYWANEHLKPLIKSDFVLGLPLEGFCSKKLLVSGNIVPFYYSDGLSKEIAESSGINFLTLERNGTVSGSALKLAQKITDREIFFCGLDLCENKGFQHMQPNVLEINGAVSDFKINSKEKRIFRTSLKNYSLEIYKNWFSEQISGTEKVYRVIDETFRKNSLGKIKDIPGEEFENYVNNFGLHDEKKVFFEQSFCNRTEFTEIKNAVLEKLNTEKWQKQLFPLDFIALSHSPQNLEQKNKLERQILQLKKKIQDCF